MKNIFTHLLTVIILIAAIALPMLISNFVSWYGVSDEMFKGMSGEPYFIQWFAGILIVSVLGFGLTGVVVVYLTVLEVIETYRQ